MRNIFALSAFAIFALTGAKAADFPLKDKPITIVVPFAAGGPTDRVARDLADALRQPLGANVVIENVAGAGGTIGANKVAKASPDGYTLLLHHIGMATAPALYRKMPYSPLDDFEYLGLINDVPMTLIGRTSLPATNFKELQDWLIRSKSSVNLANAGLGAASHLCGLLLQSALKIDMTTVPYKGTAPALNDLMGGQIDLLCDQTTNTKSQIEAKTVKVFGVTTLQRLTLPTLKNIPTLNEAGLKGFEVSIWHGLYAPKGTPSEVTLKINKALKQALKNPQFKKSQQGFGVVVVTDKRTDPMEHKKFVTSEMARWGAIIHASGVYAD